MPWSTIVSGPLGLVAGIVGGEVAGAIARELGADEDAERIAIQLGHGLSTLAVGGMINAMALDVVGGGATAGQAVAGAYVHSELHSSTGPFSAFVEPVTRPA